MDLEANERKLICLSSSADMDIYPSNSRTFFCNKCPLTIRPRSPDDNLYVRLLAVGLSVDTAQDPQPGHVKVHLYQVGEQLEPTAAGGDFNRLLGGFTHPSPHYSGRLKKRGEDGRVPQSRDGEPAQPHYPYTYKSFGYTPHLVLRHTNIDHFQVLLTDSNNQRFRVERGAATLLLLEVVSEAAVMDRGSFNVTCRSYQPALYPDNTLNRFTVPLPEMFELRNYEMTLLNVVYPQYMTEDCHTSIRVEDEIYDVDLQNIDNLDAWIATVNRDLARGELGKQLRLEKVEYEMDISGRRFHRLALIRRRLPPGQQQANYLQVGLSWNFLRLAGAKDANRALLMMTMGQRVEFEDTPSLDNVLPNPVAILMSDAVNPGAVGNELKPVFTCVEVKHQWFSDATLLESTSMMYEPAHLHYTDVKPTPFSSISFEFNNPGHQLTPRNFRGHHPTDAISVTIAFRPKRLT